MAVIKIPDASFYRNQINLWMFELPLDGVVKYLLVSSVH